MQVIPLLKKVIKQIDARCHSFLWAGSGDISRKAFISWKKVCTSKNQGGLNLVDMKDWKVVQLLKLLWNISRKSDDLWIRWIHCYYMKENEILEISAKTNWSWIFKVILKQRQRIFDTQTWSYLLYQEKTSVRQFYQLIKGEGDKVD
ncbi:unnamed protein product [Lathyrus sativus]|nr:unnamed protein product [Lathyrus sativus]